ncbi:HlyD family efflux transporter periplasmic adaptor subunit [Roseomonas sp. KE2513]|uniref:HlyD family efflux transporter periplasmic adaptor subunit n=1 Tax=Roseomonas sp. KE2513 TaxID=2479202 RepID=UPI0018DF8F54|nr:efflux RND transporter periplasmic adaptor subunit [Roseomonas sp. KE2513]MBI0536189.1 HlyD family efflux transporter periplasmic adaptor subunit [Roseomonas sp. KE2513]
MKRLALLAILLLAAGAAVWTARIGPFAPPPVVAPAAAEGPVGVGALGRVEPAGRIRRLAAPATGARLDRLMVAEGDTVKAGQVLAEFADAAQRDASVTEALARVSQAAATLDRTQAGGSPSEIAAAEARAEALRAAEETARRDAGRAQSLVASGAGAAANAERNRYLAAQRTAERAAAEAELETLRRPRAEDIARAEADLSAAQGALDRARADAALARLRAPSDGTVLRIITRAGEAVGSEGVLEMGDLSHLDVVADVYETDLPRLRPGAEAEVVVPGESRRLNAVLREIGWVVRRTTQAGTDPVAAVDARTVEVRLTLDEAARAALSRRSGMQVQVAIRP